MKTKSSIQNIFNDHLLHSIGVWFAVVVVYKIISVRLRSHIIIITYFYICLFACTHTRDQASDQANWSDPRVYIHI